MIYSSEVTQLRMKQAIQSVMSSMTESIMNQVLIEDPFLRDAHRTQRPLCAMLVPDEIFKGSHVDKTFAKNSVS
jgi:hypothetical protein